MFQLVSKPIDAAGCLVRCGDPGAGGIVVFEGRVRNHNDGREVRSLEYEAYPALAEREGARILLEALERFDIMKAVCVHRTGHLGIEDIAVWIGASSAHRRAAFEATQFIIDEVKLTVPIWKKEHYVDGDSEWVNCAECGHRRHQDAS